RRAKSGAGELRPPRTTSIARHDNPPRRGGRAAFGFNGNGHAFRGVDVNVRIKLEAQVAAGVGREDASADRSLQLRVDEPELVALVWRQRREMLQRDEAALVLRDP